MHEVQGLNCKTVKPWIKDKFANGKINRVGPKLNHMGPSGNYSAQGGCGIMRRCSPEGPWPGSGLGLNEGRPRSWAGEARCGMHEVKG